MKPFGHNTRVLQTTDDRQTTSHDNSRTLHCNGRLKTDLRVYSMHWIDSDVDLPTLDRVELNQHAKQLGQMLFRYRPESGSGHTDTGQITLPGPLKWSVGLVIHTKNKFSQNLETLIFFCHWFCGCGHPGPFCTHAAVNRTIGLGLE